MLKLALSWFFLAVLGAALSATGPWGSPGGATDPNEMTYNLPLGRQKVDCKASLTGRSVVIVTVGQSLMANTGDPKGSYVPAAGAFNFNWMDKNCYVARDPLLGTVKAGANQATRLADLLVAQSIYDSVMLVPLAHGGTFIKEWAPGGDMHLRLIDGLEAVRMAGLMPDMILWEQGEAEAGNPPQPPSRQKWIDDFVAMARSIRTGGVLAPIYVARSTICRNAGSEVIRSAQAAVVNGVDVLTGPDIDTISIADRWDGCHLGITGLERAAHLWFAPSAANNMSSS
jgi:hypothetical protein